MKLPKLTAVIEKEAKWYVATCPELGVASQGRTNEEAELMLQEAVELLLEEADETEIRRVMESIPQEDWRRLETYLPQIPALKPGLYKMPLLH